MHKVVIIGGGIAGILAATHLGRHLKGSASTSVLLIDHNFAHVWKPMLHTFAAGTANYSTQSFSFAPLDGTVSATGPASSAGSIASAKRWSLAPSRCPTDVASYPADRFRTIRSFLRSEATPTISIRRE